MLPSGTVTFLFTDIEHSTQLWEAYPQAMQDALAQHDAILQQAVSSSRGHVVKTTGDGLHAVFDTAVDAVSAAIAGQLSLTTVNWAEIGTLRVRMALHTAEAQLRDGDYYGPALNRAARLMSTAAGEQVLLSAATAEIVRDQLPDGSGLLNLGRHRLRDLSRLERIYQLTHTDLPQDFAPLKAAGTAPNNLPAQLTSFVGRGQEVADLGRLLLPADHETAGYSAAPRLVTLTGPGGTGKTRLSLQVAFELLERFTDGVFFVDLAPVTDVSVVMHTVALTLGLRVTAGKPVEKLLSGYLDGRDMLLLLDNFEQVIDAAPFVGELLARTAVLKIIVTSRESLQIYGEQEYQVPAMRLPASQRALSLAELLNSESIYLFVQRAQAVQPDFQLTEVNGQVVAQICRRLEGLPLAIELAAARIRFFGPDMLLTRLDSRLELLKGGPRGALDRQRTLANTIGWSYDLLEPQEQLIFQRLSVFNGGCTALAVEVVCSPGINGSILDILESLLNKSLLRRDRRHEEQLRFIMLETIREFAVSKLRKSGEAELLSEAHAAYFTELAEEAYPHLFGGAAMTSWLWRLEAEHDNLWTALNWAFDGGDVNSGLRLAGALGDYWRRMGHHIAGQRQINRALTLLEGASPEIQARVLAAAGELAYAVHDSRRGRAHYGRALAIHQSLGNDRDIARTAGLLSYYGMMEPTAVDEAIEMCRQSLAVLRRSRDRVAYSLTLNIYGELLRGKGDLAGARLVYEEGLAVALGLEDRFRESMQLGNLGLVDLQEGKVNSADLRLRRRLQIAMETGIAVLISPSFDFLAWTAVEVGSPRRAAQLVGASEAVHLDLGILPQPGDLIGSEQYIQAIREQLGEETFEALKAEGRAMTMQEAITFALE